jgi:hypothetical protein
LVLRGEVPPEIRWSADARISYGSEDSAPEGAGIVLSVIRDGPATIAWSDDEFLPDGFLLTPDRPSARQRARFEVPRSSIPGIGDAGSAELVWKGGAMGGFGADGQTAAEVILDPDAGQPVVAELTTADRRRGEAFVRFELPIVVTCDVETCIADVAVTFRLTRGPWLLLRWSNFDEGLRTRAGDLRVHPWRIVEVS